MNQSTKDTHPSFQPKILEPNDYTRIGHPMSKKNIGIRLWSNNLNTIGYKNSFAELHVLCKQLQENQIDIIALQEINLDLLNHNVRTTIKKVFQEYFPRLHIIFSTTGIRSETMSKPGGIILATTGSLVSNIIESHSDYLGRWCNTIIQINKQRLSIYAVYNTSQTTLSNAGPSTIYFQQWKSLRLKGVLNPNPRKQMITDLDAYMASTKKKDDIICVMGDINEDLTNQNLMSVICNKYSLYDPFAKIHPTELSEPTYKWGSKRLDYILVSTNAPLPHRIGYQPYDVFHSSDHRGVFMDVDLEYSQTDKIPKMGHRAISSRSKDIANFITIVHNHCINNNVFRQLDNYGTQEPTLDIRLGNKIDGQMTKGILKALKACSKAPHYPWSEILHKASLRVKFWKIALTTKLTKLPPALEIIRATLTDMPPSLPARTTKKKKLKEALIQLRKIRQDSHHHRKTFLHNLKQTIATRQKTNQYDPKKALEQVEKMERTKQSYQQIRKVFNTSSPQPLVKIKIPTFTEHIHPETGDIIYVDKKTHTQIKKKKFTIVDTKNALEEALIKRNKKHLRQAKSTPWKKSNLRNVTSSNEYWIEPKIQLQETIEAQTIINLMKRDRQKNYTWDCEISFEEFIEGFERWNERTSTSPSGRHLGVYKALILAMRNRNGEFGKATKNKLSPKEMAESILKAIYILATRTMEYGLHLKRWQKVVAIMIYKKVKNIEIENLRIIDLFEADFNLLIGTIFGRRAMYNQIRNKTIHQDQHGRPGGECQDVIFTKLQHYTLSNLTKTPMGHFESDAASCFDRIVMEMALTCFRNGGANHNTVKMWEQTLQNAQHHIKTAYGTSKICHKNTIDNPIIGPGQGSRGAVSACATTTSMAIKAYEKLATGYTGINPRATIFYTNKIKMFVDDASKYTNLFLQWIQALPPIKEVTTQLQSEAQIWERCLWTLGGLLRLKKCLYYIIYWKFDSEGKAFLAPPSQEQILKLHSSDSSTVTRIKQYDPTKEHETLGHFISPSLEASEAVIKLQKTASDFIITLHRSHLSRYELLLAYYTVLIPRLTYTFSTTMYTEKTLTSIQNKIAQALLPRLGYSSKTPKEVVYGSPKYGGISLRNLFIEQGIAKINIFFRHMRANTKLSQIILINLEWTQLLCGTSKMILQEVHQDIIYVQNWYIELRNFLKYIGGSISTWRSYQPVKLQRENDVFLMDKIIMNISSKQILETVNRVRIWMRVTTLSEITTADGHTIERCYWTGQNRYKATLLWPQQPKPPETAFTIWRRCLSTVYLLDPTTRATKNRKCLELNIPLGSWLYSARQTFARYNDFYSPTKRAIYVFHQEHCLFQKHEMTQKRTRNTTTKHFKVRPSTTIDYLPIDAVPINPQYQHTAISATIHQTFPRRCQHTATSWNDYLSKRPQWEVAILQTIIHLDLQALITRITLGDTIYICSDGGARTKYGSFAAAIASEDRILISMRGPVQGDSPGSFRTEASGMLSPLLFLLNLRNYFNLNCIQHIHQYTDSDSLILRINDRKQTPPWSARAFMKSEIDLEMQIIQTLKLLSPKKHTLEHVKGHQDANISIDNLTWKAKLNVYCDHLATRELQNISTPLTRVNLLPASRLKLDIARVTITHHITSQIRYRSNDKAIQQYLIRKYHWNHSTYNKLDIDIYHKLFQSFNKIQQRFYTKLLYGALPLNSTQFKHKLSTTQQCPVCRLYVEDESHFLHCTSPIFSEALQKIKTASKTCALRYNLDPGIVRIFRSKLTTIRNHQHYEQPYAEQNSIQDQIGKDSIFKGLFAKGWIDIQNKYLRETGLPTNKNQAETGVKELARSFMIYTRQRWDARNDTAHNTTNDKCSYKHIKLVMEMKHLQAQQEDMLIEDRVLFEHYPKKIETMKTHQIQKLIRNIAPIVRQSKREAKKLGKRQRKITAYYRPQKKQNRQRQQTFLSFTSQKTSHTTRPPPEPDPDSSKKHKKQRILD